jgi:hypothetical protein
MSQGEGPDPLVGMTGARFGGGRRARKAAAEAAAEAAAAVTEPLPEIPELAPGVGTTGARFGGRAWPEQPVARADDLYTDEDGYGDGYDGHGAGDEYGDEDDSGEIAHIAVRPYVLTGGRTRPAVELAIEALVSVAQDADPLLERRTDHAAVLGLCDPPRSVAEIAALMQVALGVARVLVGDLAQSGAVVVHRTSGETGPDLALLERVLSGLRRL